jgi:hypothetical protein
MKLTRAANAALVKCNIQGKYLYVFLGIFIFFITNNLSNFNNESSLQKLNKT